MGATCIYVQPIPGELFYPNLDFLNTLLRGNVNLAPQSRVLVAGEIGGELVITAQDIEISNSILQGGVLPGLGEIRNKSGSLTLDSTKEIRIVRGSIIENNINRNSIGRGGNLILKTRFLEVKDGSQLNAVTVGEGDAGNILIKRVFKKSRFG